MWADTFLTIERAHFLRLGVWGVACGVVGTALLALLMLRRQRSLFRVAVNPART